MLSVACKRCGANGESGSASCDYCGAIDRSTTIAEEAFLAELAVSVDRRLPEHEDRYHSRVVNATAIPLFALLFVAMALYYFEVSVLVQLAVAAVLGGMTILVFLGAVGHFRERAVAAGFDRDVRPETRRELASRALQWSQFRNVARAKLPPTSDLIRCLSLEDAAVRSADEREAPSEKPDTSSSPSASVAV